MNVDYPPSGAWSRKLAERLEALVEEAERLYGARVTVLPPLHDCYDAGYDAGYDAAMRVESQ